MSKHYTTLLVAVGLALTLSGTARADGDGGDNSMSRWTGESYAAFQRGQMGDFYTDPKELAGVDEPLDKTTEHRDTRLARADTRRAKADTRVAKSSDIAIMHGRPGAVFRDDTAA